MSLIHLATFLVLSASIIDDLRLKKIRNKLLLLLLPIVLTMMIWSNGVASLLYISLPSVLLSLVLTLPLYFLKMIGGGDVKLLFVVSITWTSLETFWSFTFSLPWACLFGVLRAVFKRQGHVLFQNMVLLFQKVRPSQERLQTFPYSIALLLGWMTFQTIRWVK